MTDNLRNRIEAALNQSLKSQAKQNGFANEYQPYDDDGKPYGHTLIRVDAALDPHALADAVIEALNLKIVVDYMSVDGQRRNFMLAGNYTTEKQ